MLRIQGFKKMISYDPIGSYCNHWICSILIGIVIETLLIQLSHQTYQTHHPNLFPRNISPNFLTPSSSIQRFLANAETSQSRTSTSCQVNKVELTYSPGKASQYIQYDIANFPPLHEFFFCIWIKTWNLTTEHVLFSYAVDKTPDMITMWISPIQNQTGFHMVINGIKVYNIYHPIPTGEWLHICQSWNSRNGHWDILVNDERVGDGYGHPDLIGFRIPGGGKAITGIGQDDFLLKESKSLNHGIHGEITLFEMQDQAPVLEPQRGSKVTTSLNSHQVPFSKPGECLTTTGNIISWTTTHLRLFGGAGIYGVNSFCGPFPKS